MKALKRTLTLLLTAAVMTAAIPYAVSATEETATVSDGTTDSAEQIGISTAKDFLAMESGKSYYLKNDIDFAGKTYVTLVATFNGVLDGRGHALKNFTLTAFPTMHDTPESVGYVLTGKDARFGVCTDTGCVTAEMLDALAGCDAAVIEANHDVNMLRTGRYPVYLKRRILSDRGHLSNEACAQLACALAKTGVRSLVLGHLSRENNRPGLAERAVREALDGEGFSAVTLRVAPAEGDLELEVTPCCASN